MVTTKIADGLGMGHNDLTCGPAEYPEFALGGCSSLLLLVPSPQAPIVQG